jgi:hypothetical protein
LTLSPRFLSRESARPSGGARQSRRGERLPPADPFEPFGINVREAQIEVYRKRFGPKLETPTAEGLIRAWTR